MGAFSLGSEGTIAFISGTLALFGALLGNWFGTRYLHVLEVKVGHRKDLEEIVLRPWLAHIQDVVFGELQQMASEDLRHWRSHDDIAGSQSSANWLSLDDGHDLWSKSNDHWKNLHSTWADINRLRNEIGEEVGSILYEIGDEYSRGMTVSNSWMDPTWVALSRAASENADQEFEFTYEIISKPILGAVEGQYVHILLGRHEMEDLYLQEGGDPAEFTRNYEEFLTRRRVFERVRTIDRKLSTLKDLVESLEHGIQRAIYMQDLPGRCSYCPHILPLTRLRGFVR